MKVTEIYNLLLAGKKLRMSFASVELAETFRVRMHAVKAMQEKHLLSLGMIEEDSIPVFSFKAAGGTDWTLQFIPRGPKREYNVEILDDHTSA